MICCHGLMHCRTIAENKTHNNDHAPLTRGAVVKVRVVNRLRGFCKSPDFCSSFLRKTGLGQGGDGQWFGGGLQAIYIIPV